MKQTADMRAVKAFAKALAAMPPHVRKAHLRWLLFRFYNDEQPTPATDRNPQAADSYHSR